MGIESFLRHSKGFLQGMEQAHPGYLLSNPIIPARNRFCIPYPLRYSNAAVDSGVASTNHNDLNWTKVLNRSIMKSEMGGSRITVASRRSIRMRSAVHSSVISPDNVARQGRYSKHDSI